MLVELVLDMLKNDSILDCFFVFFYFGKVEDYLGWIY
jgi:hypothetical protein